MHLRECFHCGLPVPSNIELTVKFDDKEQNVCCIGCQAVVNTIVTQGLHNYYHYRTSKNTRVQTQLNLKELKLYDTELEQTQNSGNNAFMHQDIFLIENITCAACSWLIEKHLLSKLNVYEVSLNLVQHKLYIKHTNKNSQIILWLYEIGFLASNWEQTHSYKLLEKQERLSLKRLGLAGILWMQIMMCSMATWSEFNIDLSAGMHALLRITSLLLTIPLILYCCEDFYLGAVRSLKNKHLSMDFSVILSITLCFLAGTYSVITGIGELYFDAIGMFVFLLLIGRYLEKQALKTADLNSAFMKILPKTANKVVDNSTQVVFVKDLHINDTIRIYAGQTIPIDGIISAGVSAVNESIITGEFVSVHKQIGDKVLAGSSNIKNTIDVCTTEIQDTQLAAIANMAESAFAHKPKIVQKTDIIAHYLLATIILCAFINFIFWYQIDSSSAIWVTLSMLISTCPCALALATPMVFVASTRKAHKQGLLITRMHVIELLSKINTVLFDKTGTITQGNLNIHMVIINPKYDTQKHNIIDIAFALQEHSAHPIARAFGVSDIYIKDVCVERLGVKGYIDGSLYTIGAYDFNQQQQNIKSWYDNSKQDDNIYKEAYFTKDNETLAVFLLTDGIREDSYTLIGYLKKHKIQAQIISGDNSKITQHIATMLSINYSHSLKPEDKLAIVQQYKANNSIVMMVGDGVNDTPGLAGADVSIAMKGGSDLAKITSDIVLISNKLTDIISGIKISKRARNIIVQNFVISGIYNTIAIPCAALGLINPFWAGIGMSVSSLLVIMNAMRV